MATDNRTNEEIFKEAWLAANKRGEQGARVRAGLAALESAGRLAGEPSEEQVEAAAEAMQDLEESSELDMPLVSSAREMKRYYRAVARAALVAAAGVTPQAESEGDYILSLIDTIKETGGAVEILGVKIQPCDEFGKVVQPSSTVDEGKMREVIGKAEGAWQKATGPETRLDYLARAVVEAIRGEGL